MLTSKYFPSIAALCAAAARGVYGVQAAGPDHPEFHAATVRICAHLGGPCGNQRDISQNRAFTSSRFFASHFREAMPSGGGSSAMRIASNASVSNPSSRANSNARRNSESFARQSWTARRDELRGEHWEAAGRADDRGHARRLA